MNQNMEYTRRNPSNTTSTPPSNGWTMVPQRRKTTATKQRRQHILPVQTKLDPIPASPNPYASLASTASTQPDQEDIYQRRTPLVARPDPNHSQHSNKHSRKQRAREQRRKLSRQQRMAEEALLTQAEIIAEEERTAIAKGNNHSKIRHAVDNNHRQKPTPKPNGIRRFLNLASRAQRAVGWALSRPFCKPAKNVHFASRNTIRHFDITAKAPVFLDPVRPAPMKAGNRQCPVKSAVKPRPSPSQNNGDVNPAPRRRRRRRPSETVQRPCREAARVVAGTRRKTRASNWAQIKKNCSTQDSGAGGCTQIQTSPH